ncbi:MAG: C1 family peptidase [Muribaculum sp.]|nr:C1 family peptidase [Muribaculum sp.]
MQHIVHIFTGDDLTSFRDQFASIFRNLHPDIEYSLFSAITLKLAEDSQIYLIPDNNGDSLDGAVIDNNNRHNCLINYFEDLYSRKVTVAHRGNESLVVIVWTKLYSDNVFPIIEELVSAINHCNSNIKVEIAGFTNDAVTCFIPKPKERLNPGIYKSNFSKNIDSLRKIRRQISALRLISNRNIDNVSLDLNERAMARICAEFSAIICKHYLSIHSTVISSDEFPVESFGISSILFDLEYYKEYIRSQIIIDKLLKQGIDNISFNINALARRTNPVIKATLNEIHDFYKTKTANAKASLALSGGTTASDVVGSIDKEVKDIVEKLRLNIQELLSSGKITIFECEALLALVLGDDCSMFDSSAVNAKEATIDDIIDDSAKFFIDLDVDRSTLKNVSQQDIKKIRSRMRNIAVANRKREERLATLNMQIKDNLPSETHIEGDRYRFGGIGYKLDLNIDKQPLEHIYESHNVKATSIDMRNIFAPIRNQETQGCCAAFAVASVIEALLHDSNRYSPAFLYWNARKSLNSTEIDSGATLYEIIRSATENGICPEENMPYNPAVYSVEPSEKAFEDAKKCKVLEALSVEPNIADIKSAISDGYPVIIASRIFDSFSDTNAGFIKHPSKEEITKDSRTDGQRNHAMVVCGYSDQERIFVVRNSWGADFGDNGYCYIPYSYAQKYFLQACIITKVTTSTDSKRSHVDAKTLNFNISDRNIEIAILQNLIDEDRFDLESLAEKSNKLKTDWTRNIATLENANTQSQIVEKAKNDFDKKIQEVESSLELLQSSKNEKLIDFKQYHLWKLIGMGVLTVISWILLYFLHDYSWYWIIVSVITLFSLSLIGTYGFSWRKYRQDLRDQIQTLSNDKNRLQEQKASLDIKAHIHGTIIGKVENYRLSLLSQYHKLHLFDTSWLLLYNKCVDKSETMTPNVPYPFLAVLNNDLLHRYYSIWQEKMLKSIELKSIYDNYSIGSDLEEIVKADSTLNKSIVRGLNNFSMKEYVSRQNLDKWQFLPDSTKMSEVIPDLDSRAKPFCYFNPQIEHEFEKYIFIKDITQTDMSGINPYFSQAPIPIKDDDPYSISILNVARYNL